MDNVKTGALIRKLRKEKGLTQLQLAEQLHITDRAVSKWERGLCAPDIALLEPLAKILSISILELIEGQCSTSPLSTPEIEDTAIAVIDYSSYEITRKVKTGNRRCLILLAAMLLFAGIGGYILWHSGLPFIIDRTVSPDGLYTVTVYHKQLGDVGFTLRDATSMIVQKNGNRLSDRFDFGNVQYQGVYWAPDSQKYVICIRSAEGTHLVLNSLVTSSSVNLSALLSMGVNTTELQKYGHLAESTFPNIEYQFLQWAIDSESMLIYYRFHDQANALHEGYFWYNYQTGHVSAILEMELQESEES